MKKVSVVTRLLASLAISIVSQSSAQAVVIDQFQLDGSEQVFGIHSANTPSGQSFTMGITGRIDALELSIGFSGTVGGDLVVSLIDLSGGNFSAAPELASVSITNTGLGARPTTLDFTTVTGTLLDFSAFNVQAAAGDVLGFKLLSAVDLPEAFLVDVSLSNPYGGGAFYSSGVVTVPGRDAAFKVFVTPSQVPEPVTLSLFGLGLAGLGFARRRKTA